MIAQIWTLFVVFIFQLHFSHCSDSNKQNNPEQLCSDCRLTGSSVEDLVRKPRQMDPYGQVSARIDLDKIKKAVCRDILNDSERERCRAFYFRHEPLLHKWKQQSRVSYVDFVCIKELKYCCPESSYGPKCSKCPKCSSRNQQCHGEGTRTGNGSCVCKPGHSGPKCDTCLPGYYMDSTRSGSRLDNNNNNNNRTDMSLCKACHRSCLYCRQWGPNNCEVCKQGYQWAGSEFGCSDIDECLSSSKTGGVCGPNTFCVNTEGSYFCYECDRACDGCHGDGPDMCLKCGKNYQLDPKSGNCLAIKQTILPPEANYYRYAIYGGLCVCTCIILHNNVYLASLIGLGVAMYISVSEYIMSAANIQASGGGQHHSLAMMEQQKQLLSNQLAHLGLAADQ